MLRLFVHAVSWSEYNNISFLVCNTDGLQATSAFFVRSCGSGSLAKQMRGGIHFAIGYGQCCYVDTTNYITAELAV